MHGEHIGYSFTSCRFNDDILYDDTSIIFNQSIDLTFASSGLTGWPKLFLEVGFVDEFDRQDLAGYGCCFVPSAPGDHVIDIQIFRPEQSLSESISSYFLGGYPRYTEPEIILTSLPRYLHNVESTGVVSVFLSTLCRGFDELGVYLDSINEVPSASLDEFAPGANQSNRLSMTSIMSRVKTEAAEKEKKQTSDNSAKAIPGLKVTANNLPALTGTMPSMTIGGSSLTSLLSKSMKPGSLPPLKSTGGLKPLAPLSLAPLSAPKGN